ncbi:hypothetical protein CVT24_003617 [Panaeolus cyanescens]|uniref:Protein EFR3 n=1 Tax=Panaeolus cyanescens TaxID=181874 RepID=A0A409Y7P5_9AGAR|nr:hypothetical protein CVT24_003617 [Panaeolus cyanescens]
MNLFAAIHVKLLSSCYPPNSTLLTAGPDYSPNSHELSRLTYYASNHPGKLAKIGSELEKRLKLECRKAKDGNARSRASLLISLAILRSLATECRRDIVLLSPYLVSSVDFVLSSLSSDLEIVVRAASIFTAWATYTTGSLTNADHDMTSRYLSILKSFGALSASMLSDQETRNRTRLIGLAALSAVINSEVLYHDTAQFGTQVSSILQPNIHIIFDTPMTMLNNQSLAVKDSPASPYLTEFRTRPAIERRAASIHIHVDGDNGPSLEDVSEASLRALFALLNHSNGEQLRYVMQSIFTSVDLLNNGWNRVEHCCWVAQKVAEWAQYQYRYVVPTWLVDNLMQYQDVDKILPLHRAVMSMIQAVFSSPTALINLSSSDILSSLLAVLLRRVSIRPDDDALVPLVECIASLGCHVYYSDQIPDLVAELIGRLVIIEVQGLLVSEKATRKECRTSAIRCIFQGLLGLLKAANDGEQAGIVDEPNKPLVIDFSSNKTGEERQARRTQVTADIWQDTLSLLCDPDPLVRRDCADALVYYITKEMPKHGENRDFQMMKHPRKSTEIRRDATIISHLANPGSKFLNAIYGYLYILAISPTLSHITPAESFEAEANSHSGQRGRPSTDARPNTPKIRKQAMISRLIDLAPASLSPKTVALEEDYANILKIMNTIQISFPVRGLLSGIPMILALDRVINTQTRDSAILQRIVALKSVLAHVWLTIAQVWHVAQLSELAEQAIKNLAAFPLSDETSPEELGLNTHDALLILASSQSLQESISSDQEHILKRFRTSWTPELALKDFETSAYDLSVRGDGVSPLLKISPALMHIENISLHSLARSTRGLGVTDLREALEGRASLSNPALARPPSVSTLDHTSFLATDPAHPALRLTKTRSRSKKRSQGNGSANEVRDVLTRLGIGKHNGSLLKTTFQKGAQ